MVQVTALTNFPHLSTRHYVEVFINKNTLKNETENPRVNL